MLDEMRERFTLIYYDALPEADFNEQALLDPGIQQMGGTQHPGLQTEWIPKCCGHF